LQIQLRWIEPVTGKQLEPLFETPIAIGREWARMPQEIDGRQVSRVVLADELVADYHALIDWRDPDLMIVNQNSSSVTKINGLQSASSILLDSDRLQIGSCEIQVKLIGVAAPTTTQGECDRLIGFLFKRRCGRTDRTGCTYCDKPYENDDPYFYERSYYPGYGHYSHGSWGSQYYYDRDRYYYDPATGNVDFTDADNISLDDEMDVDFEHDMGAS
jgi:pSer/pThr/pTyr-binding forkhead associated (FHA) protein